ncbi:MAG TPA: hypothetical protein VLW85_17640, partial [Myxococcales bacterium]|nr:hypothetical protein [Myxococcales bacterium]
MVPAALPRRAAGDALKRLLWIAPLLLLAAFCALPLPQSRKAPRALQAARGLGPLRAGAARVRIDLPEHPVLAGYAGLHDAREAAQPVFARALVVEAGGVKATVASLDTLLIPPDFPRPAGCSLLAATHTHTGPGGLWDNPVAGLLGAGWPDQMQRYQAARALATAVEQANAALAPAELQMGRELWRQGPAKARSEGPIDPTLVALRLRRPSGAAVATLVVYAMHPTSAPRDELSADWPGQVDAADAPVMVLQGAVGNATWPRDAALAEPVAIEVEKLLHDVPALSEVPLDCDMHTVEPPPLEASLRVPWLLRRAATNALVLAFSTEATQTRLRLGPLTLLGVPGEPVG